MLSHPQVKRWCHSTFPIVAVVHAREFNRYILQNEFVWHFEGRGSLSPQRANSYKRLRRFLDTDLARSHQEIHRSLLAINLRREMVSRESDQIN